MLPNQIFIKYRAFSIRCGRTLYQNVKDTPSIRELLRTKLGFSGPAIDRFMQRKADIDSDQLKETIDLFEKKKFDLSIIKAYPELLNYRSYILNDFCHLLKELGFENVTASRLMNMKQIMSNSVSFNANFLFLRENKNIIQNILDAVPIPIEIQEIPTYETSDTLSSIHTKAFEIYVQKRLQISPDEVNEFKYLFVRKINRSILGIEHSLKLIEKSMEKPTSLRNCLKYALKLYPEQIVELTQINGINSRKLIIWHTQVPVNRYLEIRKIIKKYNIPDYVIHYNTKVIKLSPDTVASNLKLISSQIKDKKYFEHVAFGHLIVNLSRFQNYMKQQKIDFKTTFDDKFVDFYLNSTFTRGNTTRFYLAWVLNVTEDEIAQVIQTHPNWRKVSFQVIHENLQYLLSQGFTHQDIFNDILIVLYSSEEIKDYLHRLGHSTGRKELGVNTNELTKSQILRLCVYFIERKCGFNGDGIFFNSKIVELSDEEGSKIESILNACVGPVDRSNPRDKPMDKPLDIEWMDDK